MPINEAIHIMDGDPGLPEITRRLPPPASNATPEARVALARLVEDVSMAAREILQRYGEQPSTHPQLERLQRAERLAPKAAEALSNIIGPALPAKTVVQQNDPGGEIRPVKILRALAAPLPTSLFAPHV